jgi:hypothetical protein
MIEDAALDWHDDRSAPESGAADGCYGRAADSTPQKLCGVEQQEASCMRFVQLQQYSWAFA